MVIEKKYSYSKKGLKPNSMGIIEGMKGFTTFCSFGSSRFGIRNNID
jgi:hypothetical protein